MQWVARFIRDENGQDVVEYGMLIAAVAIVVLVAVNGFGGAINTWFGGLATQVTGSGS